MSGWPVVRLDECSQIVSGATPSTSVREYWDGDIPWVTPKDLSELTTATISDTPRKLTAAGLAASSASLLPPGSVLFSSRAPIGHVAINTVAMATNQGFKSFVPNPDRIHAPYLYWWLQANRTYLQGLGNGATFKEVSKAVVSRIEIPVPPISEQRRIAAILDQADALRVKRRATLEHIDRLRRSIFDEMFGRGPISPVTVSRQALDHREGWPWETLTDVARLATGHTPDREVPSYWDGDIPWISLTEIRGLDGIVADSTELHVSQNGIDHSSSVLLPAGTVCFSRTASIGFVTVMGRPMATSQDFVNWVCGDSLRPLYLMHALLRSRKQLRDLSTGSTHKTIYMRVAEQFRVLVPPVALQDEFVSRIEALTSFQLRLTNSATTTDCLFASLQYRAFRGEL